MLPEFSLTGTRALVTGASKGLGAAIAIALAESGCDVALIARSEEGLRTTADAVRATGREAQCYPADLLDLDGLDPLIERVWSDGPIDIHVNNAGINIQQPALDVDLVSWRHVLDLDLTVPFFLTQAVARRMIEASRSGRIVNIASQMAEVGFYYRSAYCAAKGALVQMSKVLALEWAEQGIRVNNVGPTFVDTPGARTVLANAFIREEVGRRIPVGRFAHPREVAAAVVFLASPAAEMITGHHLLVDGGWTAQ